MIFIFLLAMFLNNDSNPVELGDVHWLRNMDDAIAESKRQCKPILILFQEVPGCQTCRQYGNEVLTHPLIVEAIETHFIPLAIFNNKGGHDADVLKKYNEPAWNNPVVRIVKESGQDIVTRISGNYSAAGLTHAMTEALIKNQGKAPMYLQLLNDELTSQKKGTASTTYTMYCFWSGEAMFGNLKGVVGTTAGWQQGKEVVKVNYDPDIISKSQLDKIASQSKCQAIAGGTFSTDKTPKYYLSGHRLRSVPMTELQKARVNSAIAEGQDPEIFLSPGQIAIAKKGVNENFVQTSLLDAWQKIQSAGLRN